MEARATGGNSSQTQERYNEQEHQEIIKSEWLTGGQGSGFRPDLNRNIELMQITNIEFRVE